MFSLSTVLWCRRRANLCQFGFYRAKQSGGGAKKTQLDSLSAAKKLNAAWAGGRQAGRVQFICWELSGRCPFSRPSADADVGLMITDEPHLTMLAHHESHLDKSRLRFDVSTSHCEKQTLVRVVA